MKKLLIGSLIAAGMVASVSVNAKTVTNTANYDITGSGMMLGPWVEKSAPPTEYYGLKINGSGTTTITFTLSSLFANTPPTMQFRLFADTDGVLDATSTSDFQAADILQYWNVTGANTVNTLSLLAGTYVFQVLLDPTPDGGSSAVVSSVPVPAAAWLFGSALFGAGALRRKQNAA